MGIGITAVGGYVPERVFPNSEFEGSLDTSDEWIVSRTGIRERRIAALDETAASLGARAVEKLLERFPGALEGLDLIVCATSTPDAHFPSTAALIAGRIGRPTLPAFDLSAACAGFGHALNVAHALISSGQHHKALVIGAETMSRILDWTDRSTAILFGDGAGAVLLERVPQGYGLLSTAMGGDAGGANSLYTLALASCLPGLEHPAAPHTLWQNGREVFKFAVRVVESATLEVLHKAGLAVPDLDLLIPHQANVRILEATGERLGLPLEKIALTLDRYGNTSAASIPLALEAYLDTLKNGDVLVTVGFGGGLAWSAACMRWYGGG